MPDDEQAAPAADEAAPVETPDDAGGRMFSPYGIASAVLGGEEYNI